MNKKQLTIIISLGILVLAGLFWKSTSGSSEQSDQTSQIAQLDETSSETETTPQTPSMQFQSPPAMEINKTKTYLATLKTTKGDIVIRLHAKETPITVNNFVFLARKKFYDNTIFHRVIKGFMIQGGDPTGTGSGGPGYRFEDEEFVGDYNRGTVAMANAGPDTNGSQFFIMHQKNGLPPNYVIFGEVTEGMDVVDAIATAKVDASRGGEMSNPVDPVKIESVTITEK